MIIKTLDELRQVDVRTLRFTPMGLGLGLQMRPEGAAEFQQQVVAQFEIAPQVAEGTRNSFEALRAAFAYGVFCYEIFTLVNDRALLVFEQALRDRFVEHHQGTVTFVDPRDSSQHPVGAVTYQQMHDVLRGNRRWRLLLDDGQTMAFNGMLGDLRTWARRLGLLRGQRNRVIEQAIADLRNFAAHPDYHLTDPVDAARTLSDLAEIINHLWGVPTPGGRLYPAPIRREVVAVAWNVAGTELRMALADGPPDAVDPEEPWRCAVVRAVFRPEQHISDPGLREFDARYEVTQYPADLLWGPGSITDAAAWYAEHQPQPDECDYLDRTFVVRVDGTDLYLPMRPTVAAALPAADRSGQWYAIRADHPNDAFHHVRNLHAQVGCARNGPCRNCRAETLSVGRYQQVVAAVVDPTAPVPPLPADAATPWAHPRYRAIT